MRTGNRRMLCAGENRYLCNISRISEVDFIGSLEVRHEMLSHNPADHTGNKYE